MQMKINYFSFLFIIASIGLPSTVLAEVDCWRVYLIEPVGPQKGFRTNNVYRDAEGEFIIVCAKTSSFDKPVVFTAGGGASGTHKQKSQSFIVIDQLMLQVDRVRKTRLEDEENREPWLTLTRQPNQSEYYIAKTRESAKQHIKSKEPGVKTLLSSNPLEISKYLLEKEITEEITLPNKNLLPLLQALSSQKDNKDISINIKQFEDINTTIVNIDSIE